MELSPAALRLEAGSFLSWFKVELPASGSQLKRYAYECGQRLIKVQLIVCTQFFLKEKSVMLPLGPLNFLFSAETLTASLAVADTPILGPRLIPDFPI